MEYLTLRIENHIGIVTINRPPVNAINGQMFNEIITIFNSMSNIGNIRVIILRAEGKTFMVAPT